MNLNQMSKDQLLHYIDVVSFSMIDVQLFLDTHPCDEEAIKCFNHFVDLRRAAMRVYADNYGPLTLDTANPTEEWCWATQPWPWEGGCC